MKKIYFLIIFSAILNIKAQEIKEIFLLQNGKITIINLNIKNVFISIDTNGNLVNINEFSPSNKILPNLSSFSYQNDADIDYVDPDFNRPGSKNNDINFYDDFYDYSKGKLKSVYGVDFTYNDGFYNYLKGKLEAIGKTEFDYFDDFYAYQKGKIKSIGNITFEYYDDFYAYRKGKLKSIKGNKDHIIITIIND